MFRIIANLFLTGLLFGAGPCLASCGPILISYIVGTKKNILRSLAVYFLFSFSRILVYLALGVLIFFLGEYTFKRVSEDFSKYILIIGGGFIILIGMLTAFGRRLEYPFCKAIHKNVIEQEEKSILALGFVIGLLPCAPLLALFSYVGLVSKSWLQSFFYSLSFGIGTLVSPLLFLVFLAGLLPKFFSEKKEKYERILSFICGMIIAFLGIQLMMRALHA